MDRKLFVANVSWNIGEDDLYNLFAAQGPIDAMKMPINRMTGRHKGYAFIEMDNEDDAVKAVEELNGMMLDNRPLAVNFQDENRLRRHKENLYAAQPNPKLFIRNISSDTSEDYLLELFSQAGTVNSLKVPTDHYTGEPRTYGFAEMASTEEAQAVIERFNGMMLEGEELQVLFADPYRIKENQQKRWRQRQGGYGAPPPQGGYYYPPQQYYGPPPQHGGGHQHQGPPPQYYPGYPPPPYPNAGYPPYPGQHQHPSQQQQGNSHYPNPAYNKPKQYDDRN